MQTGTGLGDLAVMGCQAAGRGRSWESRGGRTTGARRGAYDRAVSDDAASPSPHSCRDRALVFCLCVLILGGLGAYAGGGETWTLLGSIGMGAMIGLLLAVLLGETGDVHYVGPLSVHARTESGPEVAFDCPACELEEATGSTATRHEQLRVVALLPFLWKRTVLVTCQACGADFVSAARADELVTYSSAKVASCLSRRQRVL